jgi:hypothetical protein
MSKRQTAMALTLVLFCWTVTTGQAQLPRQPDLVQVLAQGAEEIGQKYNLRGLSGVRVLVRDIDREVEKDGLRTADVQTDVELQLRLAGIPVKESLAEIIANPKLPPYKGGTAEERDASLKDFTKFLDRIAFDSLVVTISTQKSDSGNYYAYTIDVELRQTVSLPSKRSIEAATWEARSLGTVGMRNISTFRESVKNHINRFINDWLAVNPKK